MRSLYIVNDLIMVLLATANICILSSSSSLSSVSTRLRTVVEEPSAWRESTFVLMSLTNADSMSPSMILFGKCHLALGNSGEAEGMEKGGPN